MPGETLPVASHVVVALDLAKDRARGRDAFERWVPEVSPESGEVVLLENDPGDRIAAYVQIRGRLPREPAWVLVGVSRSTFA
jgi:hypothetical protein